MTNPNENLRAIFDEHNEYKWNTLAGDLNGLPESTIATLPHILKTANKLFNQQHNEYLSLYRRFESHILPFPFNMCQTGFTGLTLGYMVKFYDQLHELGDLVHDSNPELANRKDVVAIYRELERLQYVRRMTVIKPYFINRKKVRKWLRVNQNRYLMSKPCPRLWETYLDGVNKEDFEFMFTCKKPYANIIGPSAPDWFVAVETSLKRRTGGDLVLDSITNFDRVHLKHNEYIHNDNL